MRLPFPELVGELRGILGPRLVAYISGVKETRAVHQWADGARKPSDLTQNRLRLAFQLAAAINQIDGPEIAQAFFQGLNPQLDDRSPARLLREGDLDDIGPAVVGATRTFLIDG